MKTVHSQHSKSVSFRTAEIYKYSYRRYSYLSLAGHTTFVAYVYFFYLQLETGCENLIQALSTIYYIPPLTSPSSSIQDSLNRISKTFNSSNPESKSSQCQVVFRKRKCAETKEESENCAEDSK